MDKTPRKIPARLNKHAMDVDSPSIESCRPVNVLTKTPLNRISNNINECIVINSSASFKARQKSKFVGDSMLKDKEKVCGGILPYDSDFEDEIPLVRVKEKMLGGGGGGFVHYIDFEDEVPLAKRLRANDVPYSKNIAGGSGISVSKPINPKRGSSTSKKRKKLIQPLKMSITVGIWKDEN
ncbi:hypothetical protein KY285_033061 [Solanum tuberosum]|nr:hypothetical protein KY285_033061 [Solanum tuberosum]